jgi:hypothetical protein
VLPSVKRFYELSLFYVGSDVLLSGDWVVFEATHTLPVGVSKGVAKRWKNVAKKRQNPYARALTRRVAKMTALARAASVMLDKHECHSGGVGKGRASEYAGD